MADGDQEYYVVNPNGTAGRTTTDPGNAKVIGGDSESTPSNWNDWAYTAGGGALGYMLSKWLMGDDEDDKGKKKNKGFLKSIIPWLSAAAGAYGGHLLSGASLSEKGQSGEFAFKKNKDGTIQTPSSRPWSGKIPRQAGNVLLYSGGVTGAGATLGRIASRPDRLLSRIDDIRKKIDDMKMTSARNGTAGTEPVKAQIAALKKAKDALKETYTKSVTRSSRSFWKPIDWAGAKWNRLGRLGGFGSAGIQIGSGLLGKWVGHIMNSRRKGFDKAMRLAGVEYGD